MKLVYENIHTKLFLYIKLSLLNYLYETIIYKLHAFG